MKTYIKKHTNRKAALSHVAKIKALGGVTTLFEEDGKYTLAYHFPEKKEAKTKKNGKEYDVLSPDGKSIRLNVPPFSSLKESREYFDKWKMQFARRGYWSPTKGLIPLSNLKRHCKWVKLN